jgi:hypothetical protein
LVRCEQCGEPVVERRRRFCSDLCRWRWRDTHRAPDLSRHPRDREHRARKLAAAKKRKRNRRCHCGEPTWSTHSPYCERHALEAELRRVARRRSTKEKPKTAAQILRARERERLRKRRRPTPKERGYDAAFKRERRRVAKVVEAGNALCARCGEPIRLVNLRPEPWDLGHNDLDRTIISGPEHRACNRATAKHAARRRRTRRDGGGEAQS